MEENFFESEQGHGEEEQASNMIGNLQAQPNIKLEELEMASGSIVVGREWRKRDNAIYEENKKWFMQGATNKDAKISQFQIDIRAKEINWKNSEFHITQQLTKAKAELNALEEKLETKEEALARVTGCIEKQSEKNRIEVKNLEADLKVNWTAISLDLDWSWDLAQLFNEQFERADTLVEQLGEEVGLHKEQTKTNIEIEELAMAFGNLAMEREWREKRDNAIYEEGEESTDNDLLPIFNQYKEDTPEIRYNILKNLYEFFQCLSEKKRASMINVLPEIMPVSTNNLKNDWRYRHEFVIQCRKLCNLYGNEEINRTISAIALTMANDKIAEVRTEAVLLIVETIRRLVNAEKIFQSSKSDSNEEKMPLTSNLLKDVITSFAKTQKWSRRLTFTHICRGLLEQKALSQDQFRYFLLAQLFGMTSDKVANVRLSACKVLALLDYDLSPQPFIGEITPTVKDILKKLSNDNDMDVAREAKLTLKEEIEDKTDMALRGRKIHIKESTFFKDPNISCYDIQDMSVESEHEMPKENYEVVDMDIDEPNTSEC